MWQCNQCILSINEKPISNIFSVNIIYYFNGLKLDPSNWGSDLIARSFLYSVCAIKWLHGSFSISMHLNNFMDLIIFDFKMLYFRIQFDLDSLHRQNSLDSKASNLKILRQFNWGRLRSMAFSIASSCSFTFPSFPSSALLMFYTEKWSGINFMWFIS